MDYSSLRVIVVRENWAGCTGLAAANALSRLGAAVQSVVENEFLPAWQSTPMKIVGKLVRKGAIRELNAALVRVAASFRPNLALIVKGQFVYPESIQKLKELGARCVCFYPDISFFNQGPYIPRAIPEYDWIFTTKSFGPRDVADQFSLTNCSYLPHAYDPEVHKPRRPGSAEEESRYDCDLSFIGGWCESKEAVLTSIAAALPDLSMKIWGSRWQNVSRDSILAPFIRNRNILGPDYALGVGGSKINLALLQERAAGASSADQITSRTFHIPACGGFMLHQRTSDLQEVMEEDVDCAAFGDANEAIEQVGRFLKDEKARRAIAGNGRRKVESAHSWDHRAKAILDHCLMVHDGKRDSGMSEINVNR
jgi:spore maturation protein CgeB